MLLRVMVCAKGVAIVIAITTVARVGEYHVLVLIVADPVAATVCLGQFSGFAAKPALRPHCIL